MSNEDLEIQMPSNQPTEPEAIPLQSSFTPDTSVLPNTIPERRGVLHLTVETPITSTFPRTANLRPARWKTPEYIFYGIYVSIFLPWMAWKPINLSRPSHPNYPLYSERLEDGWIFGRKIDNSDAQYRSFRNNIPLLSIIAFGFLLFKSIYLHFVHRGPSQEGTLLHRIPFLSFFSLVFLCGLHGTSTLKILFILFINYEIAKIFKSSRVLPILTWAFNMGVLFAIERNNGFSFSSISPSLAYLDNIQGAYPRWHIPFNITMLRLVSFNMDYHWACRGTIPSKPDDTMNLKERTVTPHALDIYSFRNYIAYILYPPLFIAGPIITFNDFMWQHVNSTSVPSRRMVLSYLIRFLVCMLTMELILHYMYVVAMKDTSAWRGDTPFELSMIGFWNLIIVWLKLLIPWRFFRLWALADGIDPPENMIRCMANNYSTLGFWRAWHRSYNLWIVRYIYIPLGGTKNLLVSVVLIFSFVALWHDLTFRLLAWGWLVSLFIVPEVTARYLVPSAKYGNRTWYRHVCAIGGVGNILMMMTANLVGFAIGVEGIKYMLEQLLGSLEGLWFLTIACISLFVGVQVMFEYREEEMRNGIYRKC